MDRKGITRSEFLREGSCMAAGALFANVAATGAANRQAAPCPPVRAGAGRCGSPGGLAMRPYQVLCMFCRLGEQESPPKEGKLGEVYEAIREAPDMPVTLCANAGDTYVYQDPGAAEDTPEGRDFNRKRDLDILQRMSWPPGITLPARTLLSCVLDKITTTAGLCGYDRVTSDAWKGCPKANSGRYEKGREKGIHALIAPRGEAEMAREKEESMRALNSAKEVTIRPHILLCAVCQYGGGTRPPFKPDNLPELMDLILHKNPDVLIKFARQADWMMCAPCPSRVPALNACVNTLGSGGLSNEKRDLDMLQILGLTFGDSMKARDLFRLIFEKIPSTQPVCTRDNAKPAVWWDGCGESNLKEGNRNYEKGRRELMEKFSQLT